MKSPFPGMDPYLERRGLWEEVHTDLITQIRQFLTPLLRPKYRVAIEQRTYLSLIAPDGELIGKPDAMVTTPQASVTEAVLTPPLAAPRIADAPLVGELPQAEEIIERYLEIRDTTTHEVITAIEILSPTNKQSTEGRRQYEQKRLNVLASATSLVEVDLLRSGLPFAMSLSGQAAPQSHYRIVISRSWQRPRADLYLFNLQQPIPSFHIPLRPGEQEPVLPLNQFLHALYDQGGYDLAINYDEAPNPPREPEDMAWALALLHR
ncbi:MAG: DUF4058 family protein [Caldilineaceae bacterium]|nr:DUF4058 family protein [Caldilineaceae bacterium]